MPKAIAAIRWTVERAASEFQIDRKTLTKRIRAGDILPGADGKFSTEQICAAAFGDYRREQRSGSFCNKVQPLPDQIDKNVKDGMHNQSLPELLPVYKFVPLIGGISRPTFLKRLAAGVIRPSAVLNGKPVFQRSDADRIREELEK